jgi:tetratricopeptide (TPR) repeat protein
MAFFQNASTPPPDQDAHALRSVLAPKHLLFLSHAGADADAALDLAHRIEATPAARQAGLRVWIDQRDLVHGRGWQRQLEDAIERRSTAFAVYIGARGAINWVEAEIGVALSRATKDKSYPFVPILLGEACSSDLPAFARQYHAVRASTASDPELVRALLATLLQPTGRDPVAVVDHPFVGLASFGQATAELFYGREAEVAELIERLRLTNFVMIVGDSGSGKSSLARAGLVPRFCGGVFAETSGERPDSTYWQVVEMRPQGQPFERLVDAVNGAAMKAGVGAEDRGAIADWVRTKNSAKIRDALRDCAPRLAKTLLLVDQFEELWTLAIEADRRAFIDALMGVVDGAGANCRVVLTMRRDYYNLCAQFPDLFLRLQTQSSASRYQLRRMKDAAQREVILKPLSLTGYRDDPSIDAFADAVLGDVGDRPGDLALLEMALAEAWRHRHERGGRLLDAYVMRGRVAGALANAAEDMFRQRLTDVPLDVVKGIFVRLVRLGDTGGTTRRVARRAEFTDETWTLVQRLAGGALPSGAGIQQESEHARLVAIAGEPGQETVEIAHEALVTQWPRYQTWLEDAAPDKRVFDRIIEETREWSANGEDSRYLARGADLEAFAKLLGKRPAWLAPLENQFVKASLDAENARVDHDQAQSAERERLLRDRVDAEAKAAAVANAAAIEADRLRNVAEAERDHTQRARHRLKLALCCTGVLLFLACVAAFLALSQKDVATQALRDAERNLELALDQASGSIGQLVDGYDQGAISTKLLQHLLEKSQKTVSELPRETDEVTGARIQLLNVMSLANVVVGQAVKAREFAETQDSLANRLLAKDPQNFLWRHYRATAEQRLADALFLQGKLGSALEPAQTSKAALLELLNARSDDEELQWELILARQQIGDILRAEGELTAAMDEYRSMLEHATGLAEKYPQDPRWQRSVGFAHQRIGDALQILGRDGEAAERFRAFRKQMSDLVVAYPNVAIYLEGVAFAHQRFGDALMALGEPEEAMIEYRAYEDAATKLEKVDVSNFRWNELLAFSHQRTGEVFMYEEEYAKAHDQFRAYLMMAKEASERDPENTASMYDLANAHEKVGDALRHMGDIRGAQFEYEEQLRLAGRLAEKDRLNTGWQKNLATADLRIGLILRLQGDYDAALLHYQQCYTHSPRGFAWTPRSIWPKNVREYCRQLVVNLGGTLPPDTK